MKKTTITLSALLLAIGPNGIIKSEDTKPVLEHEVLKVIDGSSIGIDGQTVGFMLKVRREIITLVTKQTFDFNGQKVTIKELRALEEAEGSSDSLNRLLETVRNKFLQTVAPFMEQAHGAKDQMTVLIEEWTEKRNRKNSKMLIWSRVPEEKEIESFHTIGSSFAIFDVFCKDLIGFLQDLIVSCPKGLAQFKQLLANKKLDA